MKMTFLGVGSAFSKVNAQSNVLIESGNIKLLVDCGATAIKSLNEYGLSVGDLTHVFISHLHADHIGGLHNLGFTSRYYHKLKLKLLTTQRLLDRLWKFSLYGLMGTIESSDRQLVVQTLDDYFDPHPMVPEQWFSIETDHDLQFYLRPSNHVLRMDSYSLEVREGQSPEKRFLFTGDMRYDLPLLEKCKKVCYPIFHDCQLFDSGENNRFGVHVSYRQLLQLPPDIRKIIWIYHYGDTELPNAEKDGFLGFTHHHQSFTW